MNPEYRVSTHDLYVSILEVECLVASRYLVDPAFSNVLA